jgi:hypothetical protein
MTKSLLSLENINYLKCHDRTQDRFTFNLFNFISSSSSISFIIVLWCLLAQMQLGSLRFFKQNTEFFIKCWSTLQSDTGLFLIKFILH